MKNKRGITVMNFTEDKVRRLIQHDYNLMDSHDDSKWIEGETIRTGNKYLQITLESGDVLRVYEGKLLKDGITNSIMKFQYGIKYINNEAVPKIKLSAKYKGTRDLEETKAMVLKVYTACYG